MADGRYLVTLKDGTSVWLPEEQYQKVLSGELDLEAPLSPEKEAEIDAALEERMEQMRQLLAKRGKK